MIIDPWFEPGQLTDRGVSVVSATGDGVAVVRMSRTLIDDRVSNLEFEYLVGRPDGIERMTERHTLGLFSRTDMYAAFEAAGLHVEHRPNTVRKRGIYVSRLHEERAGTGSPVERKESPSNE